MKELTDRTKELLSDIWFSLKLAVGITIFLFIIVLLLDYISYDHIQYLKKDFLISVVAGIVTFIYSITMCRI